MNTEQKIEVMQAYLAGAVVKSVNVETGKARYHSKSDLCPPTWNWGYYIYTAAKLTHTVINTSSGVAMLPTNMTKDGAVAMAANLNAGLGGNVFKAVELQYCKEGDR